MDEIEQTHQVFVGEKAGTIAVVVLDIESHGTTLGRTDPRLIPERMKSFCDSPEIGKDLFMKSLNASIQNGWKILYLGERNWG